jgi:hypothetical protein
MAKYKRIMPRKLTGQELLLNTGQKRINVLQFWQYAFSIINSNVLRGAFAEFLVENAIRKPEAITIRNPWADFDVVADAGTTIEVKCGAYIQDWDQENLSKIIFSGLKAKELYWSEAVKPFKDIGEADYKADVYVLAVLSHQESTTLNLLDMDQWAFYVLSRQQLKEAANNSSRVALARLAKLGYEPVRFTQLEAEIAKISGL